ncbi:MAG TPA: TatD family hydrolase [Acidobacteriota bacterium]
MSQTGPIDFHCHLDDPCYAGDRWQTIDRCFASGFAQLVTVADAYEERSLGLTLEILSRHAGIECTVGAHPHQADHYSAAIEKRIYDFMKRSKVLAVGEVGLDFHYDLSARDSQVDAFRRQVAIARECRLPLVIHSRQAEQEVLDILAREQFAQPVVFHCYTGDWTTAAEIIARGYFLSFSGIITFKKAGELRTIVAKTPLGQMFSETDSPYLSPEPDRGKTNTPLAVVRVVEKIAEIKGIAIPELLSQINKNFQRLRP